MFKVFSSQRECHTTVTIGEVELFVTTNQELHTSSMILVEQKDLIIGSNNNIESAEKMCNFFNEKFNISISVIMTEVNRLIDFIEVDEIIRLTKVYETNGD